MHSTEDRFIDDISEAERRDARVVRLRSWALRYLHWKSLAFFSAQAIAVGGVLWTGWSWSGFTLALALYFARMFFITAGYHRYFSHRSYRTSRPFQFFLAFMGTTASQNGPLWWAARHRHHHRYSDRIEDRHSPKQHGFYQAHLGWFLGDGFTTADLKRVPDFAKFPELVWLERLHLAPPIAMACVLFLIGGWHALLWGYFVSTTLLWHGTYTINSLSHLFGSRRFQTKDDSRNNLFLAIITMGEGWHNNHHHCPRSERQGFRWWEIDLTHYVLSALAAAGLVWDRRGPPGRLVTDRPAAPIA